MAIYMTFYSTKQKNEYNKYKDKIKKYFETEKQTEY